jgi:hypothetical protein
VRAGVVVQLAFAAARLARSFALTRCACRHEGSRAALSGGGGRTASAAAAAAAAVTGGRRCRGTSTAPTAAAAAACRRSRFVDVACSFVEHHHLVVTASCPGTNEPELWWTCCVAAARAHVRHNAMRTLSRCTVMSGTYRNSCCTCAPVGSEKMMIRLMLKSSANAW